MQFWFLHSDISAGRHRAAARREPGGNAPPLTRQTRPFKDNVWRARNASLVNSCNNSPNPDRRAQAALRQAQARCQTGGLSRGYHLDRSRSIGSGRVGRTSSPTGWERPQFQSTNFHRCRRGFPCCDAGFSGIQAAFWMPACAKRMRGAKLGDWEKVESLLGGTKAAFSQLAAASPRSEAAARGIFIACRSAHEPRRARRRRSALRRLDGVPLAPLLAWQREYLLCRMFWPAANRNPPWPAPRIWWPWRAHTTQVALQAQSVALQPRRWKNW